MWCEEYKCGSVWSKGGMYEQEWIVWLWPLSFWFCWQWHYLHLYTLSLSPSSLSLSLSSLFLSYLPLLYYPLPLIVIFISIVWRQTLWGSVGRELCYMSSRLHWIPLWYDFYCFYIIVVINNKIGQCGDGFCDIESRENCTSCSDDCKTSCGNNFYYYSLLLIVITLLLEPLTCPGCSEHGTCANGVCVCSSSWTGPTCSGITINNKQKQEESNINNY